MPDTQVLADTAPRMRLAANYRHKRVGYVALNVTDVERTMEFATNTFALDPFGAGPSGERFLRANMEHHSVVLYPAKEPGFVRLGLELETEEDVGRAFAHIEVSWGIIMAPYVPFQLLRPVGMRPGVDHADQTSCVVLECPTRYLWDGEIGYGWLERTRPLSSLHV